jgi:hypothetical protein
LKKSKSCRKFQLLLSTNHTWGTTYIYGKVRIMLEGTQDTIHIHAESITLILWWLAGLLWVNEVMSNCRMNAIKNKSLYLFCRVESLLLYHKHRIKHNDTLNADAYIWWKVGKNTLGATFLYVLLVWGVVEQLRLCQKLLILYKSLNKHKLDSLAYSCGMRVFAYIVS